MKHRKSSVRLSCIIALITCTCICYLTYNTPFRELTDTILHKQSLYSAILPSMCWTWLPVSQWQQHIDIVFETIGPGSLTILNSTSTIACKTQLETIMENNLHNIDSYPRAEQAILDTLELDDSGISILSGSNCQQQTSLPVIVTGASSNHFNELKGLLTNIKNIFNNNIVIIVYDLGLKNTEKSVLGTICKRCQYKSFNFSSLPEHVKYLNTFTWKPIIIQQTLRKFPSVIWADTSIRFTHKIYQLINMTKYTSVMFNGLAEWDTYAMTQPSTFNIINEEPCLFDKPSVQGGFGIFYRNPLTLKYIMRPWISCALTKGCMALNSHKDDIKYLHSCGDKSKWMFRCHRFDQSFLSILMKRIFGNKRKMVMSEEMLLRSVYIAGRTWPFK